MGKLIVFEGLDCSGKETQVNLLRKFLEEKKYLVKVISFPNYETPTGKILSGPFLGKSGKSYFEETSVFVDSKVSAMLFALDRYYSKDYIVDCLKDYDFVIVDRYVYSNMIYQGVKEKEENFDKFVSFVSHLEFELLELPKPDLIFFLDVSLAGVTKLLAKRKQLDTNEKDLDYLARCKQGYERLTKQFPFEVIPCMNSEKELKKSEEISFLIQDKLLNYMNSLT